jgi:ATP-binding cassette subfamily B protein
MLVAGGIRVVGGQMSPGSLVAMFRYLHMLIWPLMGAGFMVNLIQRGAVSLSRVNEVLNTIPSIRDDEQHEFNTECHGEEKGNSSELRVSPCNSVVKNSLLTNQTSLSPDSPALEVRNLNFEYIPGKPVLKGIDFSLRRGEWLGIMGHTGSGKSTLIKTFTRMVDPPPGTVFVKGFDAREYLLSDLRGLFAVSPQDSYLFSDSIRNNIGYGLDSDGEAPLTEEQQLRVRSASGIASLEKDIAGFNQGWDTLVGERGLTLSGGQKQRVAIARSVIMDSELLILDDSLSSVDTETEERILEEISRERKSEGKNRTTIIISHRVSTLRYTDRVLVLEDGRIAELGTARELASAGGYFARVSALQRLESREDFHG